MIPLYCCELMLPLPKVLITQQPPGLLQAFAGTCSTSVA